MPIYLTLVVSGLMANLFILAVLCGFRVDSLYRVFLAFVAVGTFPAGLFLFALIVL